MVNAKEIIFGHIVGDALGLPVQFLSREELFDRPVVGMESYGTYRMPAGSYSDDGSMTLATIDSILECGCIDANDIAEKFVCWLFDGMYTQYGFAYDNGRGCTEGIKRFANGRTPAAECGGTTERDNGNGSLMRIIPAILFGDKTLANESDDVWNKRMFDIITVVSSITHGHSRAHLACQLYAMVFHSILHSEMSIVDHVKAAVSRFFAEYGDHPEIVHFNRLGDVDAFKKLKAYDIKSSGYVIDTIEAALWCLLNTNSYADCVLMAVNLGGDTDTIAAVVGGLAGAFYGVDEIPNEWLATISGIDAVGEMCDEFDELLKGVN